MRIEVYGCSGTNHLIFLKVVSPSLYVGEAMALWLVRWTRGRKLLERLVRPIFISRVLGQNNLIYLLQSLFIHPGLGRSKLG